MENKRNTTALREKMAKRFAPIPSQMARRMFEIELSKILPNPNQPRKTFDDEHIQALASSIEQHGQLQPIILKESGDGEHYLLVAGECRLRAHRLLGSTHIYAVMTDGSPDEISLIENIQRQDLNPLEEAAAMARMMEHYHYTQEELARIVGKARATVTNILKLNTLPPQIKEECSMSNMTSKSLLMEIARLPSSKAQLTFWEQAKQGKLTVKAARQARERKPAARNAASTVQQMLAAGYAFVHKLRQIDPSQLANNKDQLAELIKLRAEIDILIGGSKGRTEE